MLYLVFIAVYVLAALVFIVAICFTAKRPLPRLRPESLRVEPAPVTEQNPEVSRLPSEPVELGSTEAVSTPGMEATPDPAQP